MSNKTISILGSGWLGLPLSDLLVKEGHQIHLSSRSTDKITRLKAKNKQLFKLSVEADCIEGDFHAFLDADILIINIPPSRRPDVNNQFNRLVPLIESSPIQKIIFVSATSVYRNNNGWVREDRRDEKTEHPLLTAENLFLNLSQKHSIILRMAGLIGGKRHPGQFFQKKNQIPNSLAPINLIHRSDCLQILKQMTESNGLQGIFNVCADKHPSKGEFYSKAAKSIGLEIPLSQPLEESFKFVSNQKLKNTLDYTFIHPNPSHLLNPNKWY